MPWGIVVGPDKAIWFTESGLGKIGRIDSTGKIAQYALPKGSAPQGITVGPDKALWYADRGLHRIGRLTMGGAQSYFSIPPNHKLSAPANITVGPDRALWFTSLGASRYGSRVGAVGRMTLSGQFSKVEKGMTFPFAIVTGPDGALWVAQDYTTGNPPTLVRIQLASPTQ